LCSLFLYHIVLLRLPTTFRSLALDAFFLQDSLSDAQCELDLWDSFTEILLKQWKTLGLFSTLIFGCVSSAPVYRLLISFSATLTMFQIPSVTDNSLLGTSAHCALLCVMMSLIYTSLLSVYFGSWRSQGAAARWVQVGGFAFDLNLCRKIELIAIARKCGAQIHTLFGISGCLSRCLPCGLAGQLSIQLIFSMERKLPTNFTCISRGILLFLVSMILFVWPLGHYDSSEDVNQESSLGTKLFLVMVVVVGGVHLALMILKLRRVTSNVVVAVDVGNPV
jgi:hypothetical protein